MTNYGIVQGYRGFIMIGDAVYPAMPGSSVAMPKNYSLPPVIAGVQSHQYVAIEGLQFPVFNMNLLPTSQLINPTKLKPWYERTFGAFGDPGADDMANITGTSGICDGHTGFSVEAVKCASCNLGVSQGELVRFSAQFWGSGDVTFTDHTLPGAPTAYDMSIPATGFQHTGYAGTPLATKGLISWDLSWSNNLMPNPAIPEAGHSTPNVYPNEVNAGMLTARLRLVLQADKVAPQDGEQFTLMIKPPGTNGVLTTVTIKNPLMVDPVTRSLQMPRSLREYNYILRGYKETDNSISYPFTIA